MKRDAARGEETTLSQAPRNGAVIRSLSVVAVASISICNMIGQGVFLKARVMTCNVGSPTIMLAAWTVAGLLALCGALTLAELSSALPESGGIYAFLRRAFGKAPAFSFGWMILFIAAPASSAALASGAAIFLNVSSGRALEAYHWSAHLGGMVLALSGLQVAAIVFIVVVTAINFAPALVNGRIASVFAVLKLAMLAGVTIGAFALGHGTFAHFVSGGSAGTCAGIAPAARVGVAGFAAALIGALYAYNGWHSVTLVAGEVKDPVRTFPIALSLSVALAIVTYVGANIAFVYVLGPVAIASIAPGSSVGISVVETLFGPLWQLIAAGFLFASVGATLHVTIFTNARVTYALAGEGLGFGFLARLSPRARVPVNALVANGILSVGLLIVGSFDTLSDYLIFNSWVYFVAAAAALFILRRREPNLPRPYRRLGYPLVPAIFVAVSGWLLIQTLISDPRNSIIGLIIVGLSFPVFYWRERAQHRPS